MPLRRVLATFAFIAVLGLAAQVAPATATHASVIVRVVDVGSGAAEAWAFLPEEKPDCVITFIHDDGDVSPTKYTSWLDYTVLSDHCAIVFPRYQKARGTSASANLNGLRAAISTGMRYISRNEFPAGGDAALRRLPAIAAGLGSGATMALLYATTARQWGYRAPAAVDVVFPVVTANAPLPNAKLAAGTRVLVQMGDRDASVAPRNAGAVRRFLSSHSPRPHVEVVRSTADLAVTRGAPLLVNTAAENAFWGPLDNLIGSVTP